MLTLFVTLMNAIGMTHLTRIERLFFVYCDVIIIAIMLLVKALIEDDRRKK